MANLRIFAAIARYCPGDKETAVSSISMDAPDIVPKLVIGSGALP